MSSINNIDLSRINGISQLDNLVAETTKLVSLPDIYYRLEALIEQPDSSMDDFAEILSADPDLCARLLSIANSAFYSFPTRIDSVSKAVRTIGLRQIRELVLATTVMKMFNKMPLGMVNMTSFWEHSVGVGVLAVAIAKETGQPQSERYYVAGLLHDIGRLILFLKLPGLMRDLLLQREVQEKLLFLLETDELGYSHAEIGGRLLENWRVPQSISEPVYYHHYPEKSLDFSHITAAVHIADACINEYRIGSSGERFVPEIDESAMILLGLDSDRLKQIWSDSETKIHEVIRQFVNH